MSVFTLLSIVLGYVLPMIDIPPIFGVPISTVVTFIIGITLTAVTAKRKIF